jgi:hypothetical protein
MSGIRLRIASMQLAPSLQHATTVKSGCVSSTFSCDALVYSHAYRRLFGLFVEPCRAVPPILPLMSLRTR